MLIISGKRGPTGGPKTILPAFFQDLRSILSSLGHSYHHTCRHRPFVQICDGQVDWAGTGTVAIMDLPLESVSKRSVQRGSRSREGQALLEFAAVAFVLAMMLFGVLEFGRAYFASIAVTNAARDGARVAMDPSRSDADVKAAAENAAGSIKLTDVEINRSLEVGKTSSITAYVDFETGVPLISQLWGGGPLRISYTATSRVGWE